MVLKQELYDELLSIINPEDISINEYLCNITYTKLGGKADYFITPRSYREIQDLINFCKVHNIPFTIIGNGSNLIVRDGGIRGIVISLKHFNTIEIDNTTIKAQSGANLIYVSRRALEHELSGLEFACGIPGSIGGAVFMNAGAYGGEIKDVLVDVVVINSDNNIVKRTKDDLELSYRHSNIGEKKEIILEATFELSKGIYDEIKMKMDDFTTLRKAKQPLEYPSCGSVFKRPKGYFAGKLIEESNLQGVRIGGAEVSTKHAGFIVNIDNATASEYINLIEHIQKTVKEKFNVHLEREVKIIGEDLLEQ